MDEGRTVSLPGVYIKYHCLARNKVKATTAGMTHCGPGGETMIKLTLMIPTSRSIVIISTWGNQVFRFNLCSPPINTNAFFLQHYTILYYTILYYTILYYTILYYTILYYTNNTPEKKNIRYNFQVNLLRQRCLMISLVGAGNTSCSKASALNSMGDVSATKTFSGFVRFCSGLCLISLHVLSLSTFQ